MQSPRVVVANVLDCNIVVSEFELQSRYYEHFYPVKGMDLLTTPVMGLVWVICLTAYKLRMSYVMEKFDSFINVCNYAYIFNIL